MPRVVPSTSIVPPRRPIEVFLDRGNVLIHIYLTPPQRPVDILRRLIAKTDRSLNIHVSKCKIYLIISIVSRKEFFVVHTFLSMLKDRLVE